MFDTVIRGGRVVDGSGLPWYRADVGLTDGRIAAVGRLDAASARAFVDATGKVVAPGFVDAHVHGDIALLADPYHEPAIRQGVTTYIVGQDGVALTPASPATRDFMRLYTAGFSGGRLWDDQPFLKENAFLSVDRYLSLFAGRSAVNAAVLVPNGNVRMEVMGLETRPPTTDELTAMRRLVREGMEQGAVGLSSGLDYIPSRYADTAELTDLCREIAPFAGVYVTHMRRYDPEGVLGSMDEVFAIGRGAGCAVHISHFNSKAALVLPKLDKVRSQGVDATYDLYCYLAGSSILGMVALPPWVQEGGIDATLARLAEPATRAKLTDWFKAPRMPLETVCLSYVAAPEYRQYEGQVLSAAAQDRSQEIGDFVCDILTASGMAVGCVAPHRERGENDVWELLRHPAMMAGSDGIFTGSCPHPRGCGCFARYLGYYVRDAEAWSLERAVSHLSYHAARRFGLKDRGLIAVGMAADVVVFDADAIADRSTYQDGRRLAVGVQHVFVNGEAVLKNGERTAALPGRGLRRS